jgi:hypothetical protein
MKHRIDNLEQSTLGNQWLSMEGVVVVASLNIQPTFHVPSSHCEWEGQSHLLLYCYYCCHCHPHQMTLLDLPPDVEAWAVSSDQQAFLAPSSRDEYCAVPRWERVVPTIVPPVGPANPLELEFPWRSGQCELS